jgi:hypothetical protein
MAEQDQPAPEPENPPKPPSELAPEDFYFEGPYLVFTEIYSDCRHCPYR